MATIGLDKLYYAEITEDSEGNANKKTTPYKNGVSHILTLKHKSGIIKMEIRRNVNLGGFILWQQFRSVAAATSFV